MGNIPSGIAAKATPIHEAAATDNVPKLLALLADGEDVDAADAVRSNTRRERGMGGETLRAGRAPGRPRDQLRQTRLTSGRVGVPHAA